MNKHTSEEGEQSPDFDFLHHLRDTLILLGGKKEIADLINKSQDGLITEGDVDRLRNYNIELFTDTKRRLNNLNRLVVQVAKQGD